MKGAVESRLEQLFAVVGRDDELCAKQRRPKSDKDLWQCPRCGCWMTPNRLLRHLEEAVAGSMFGCKHLGATDVGLAALAKHLGARITVIEEADGTRTLNLASDGTGRKADWLEFSRILRQKAAKLGKPVSTLPQGCDAVRVATRGKRHY